MCTWAHPMGRVVGDCANAQDELQLWKRHTGRLVESMDLANAALAPTDLRVVAALCPNIRRCASLPCPAPRFA